ncbi:MAG: helix-turn-helix domain-containing protein, partial [Pedobacter sp.]|nr:helix-turn-helix domain-containing protein [Pedobacter sp.]
MGKYVDDNSAKQIGEKIRKYRKEKGYSLDDVSLMTGLSINTLSSIENGGNTYVSHCIAICQALELKPSELFDIEIKLKPRFELPPARRN